MPRALPKLRITPPTGPLPPGRGFYQLEESSLYVQIGLFTGHAQFFSYLESERVRFDLDITGSLLFIEVNAGRHTWKLDHEFSLPVYAQPATVHWLDFRSRIDDFDITTNRSRSALHLRYSQASPEQTIALADNVTAEITSDLCLAGIYISDIVDDLAGQEIARFRQECRPAPSRL